jgi:alkanesulfonate monooxygenase SsuD/methylene tetrahydromethanopterin reductase-like flavin-dependent oxidoreductase (luciferase family)
LASETATLDRLSNGRLILAVGLGATDTGFAEFGEVVDRKTRAELLDEGLDIITGLWQGQPFNYNGKHYQVRPYKRITCPSPVQQPRIPIWVVGAWQREKSMLRAMRWDGLLPAVMKRTGGFVETRPEHIKAIATYIQQNRVEKGPYDIIVEGATPGDNLPRARQIVRAWEEAGATWWLEAMWETSDLDTVSKRITSGPPKT